MKAIYLKSITGIGGIIVGYLFGGWDIMLETLLSFIIFDIITGIIGGLFNKNLSSKVMRRGLIRKGYELLFVCVAFRLDIITGQNVFRSFSIWYFIATEGLSIIENLGKFIELPSFVKNFLEQLKDAADKGEAND